MILGVRCWTSGAVGRFLAGRRANSRWRVTCGTECSKVESIPGVHEKTTGSILVLSRADYGWNVSLVRIRESAFLILSDRMMSDPRTTFSSAVWNHAGKILEYFLMYVTSVLIARGLGVQENGAFVGLFSISQLLLVFVSFGLEVSLNKHIPQLTGESRNERIRYIVFHAIGVRILLMIGVAAVIYAALQYTPMFVTPRLREYIWILLGYTGVRSIVNLLAIVLTAELQTRTTSLLNVSTRVLEVVLTGLLVSGMGEMTTMNVFVVFLLTATVQLVAYLVVARAQMFGPVTRLAVLPIIMFGGMYWTNTIVEYFLGRQGDVLFLTMLLPDSTQASLYDVAFAVGQLASLSMTIGLGGITLATSARLALRGAEPLERFYGFMVRITSLLSLPLYAFLLFNAGSILFVLYSPKYLAAAGLIQGIAAFRIVGRLFGGPENSEFLLSRSLVSRLVWIGIVGAVVNVGLDLLLIPHFGAFGAVVASGCGNIAVNLLGAIAVYRISHATVQWKFWLKTALPMSAASFICGYLIDARSFTLVGVQATLFAAIAIALLVILKPLTKEDGAWVSSIEARLASPFSLFAARPD